MFCHFLVRFFVSNRMEVYETHWAYLLSPHLQIFLFIQQHVLTTKYAQPFHLSLDSSCVCVYTVYLNKIFCCFSSKWVCYIYLEYSLNIRYLLCFAWILLQCAAQYEIGNDFLWNIHINWRFCMKNTFMLFWSNTIENRVKRRHMCPCFYSTVQFSSESFVVKVILKSVSVSYV